MPSQNKRSLASIAADPCASRDTFPRTGFHPLLSGLLYDVGLSAEDLNHHDLFYLAPILTFIRVEKVPALYFFHERLLEEPLNINHALYSASMANSFCWYE